jgi:3-isopropylmalate/(R)-2-methylmalate dehydratase small subunit
MQREERPVEDSKRISISGKAIAVPGNDIDTDRIIPARFLRCVTFDGLGTHAFEDDRKQLAERGQRHPFDDAKRQSAEILVVGRNFGCGSSREHAPQALMRWSRGLRAIVGESFAEIFFGNCTAIGVPCLTAEPADLARLTAAVQADADLQVEVDVAKQEVRFGDQRIAASLPGGAREQLVTGRWDTTAELLADPDKIAKTVGALPYFGGFA